MWSTSIIEMLLLRDFQKPAPCRILMVVMQLWSTYLNPGWSFQASPSVSLHQVFLFQMLSKAYFSYLGGRMCAFSPCIEQVQRTCDNLRSSGFSNIEVLECVSRNYDFVHSILSVPNFGKFSFVNYRHSIGNWTSCYGALCFIVHLIGYSKGFAMTNFRSHFSVYLPLNFSSILFVLSFNS